MTETKHTGMLFLSANTPWVYALAQSLSELGPVTALRLYDKPNFRRLRPEWPESDSAVQRRMVVMPAGYAGTLERLFRPVMRRLIAGEIARLRKRTGDHPWVIAPYPFLAPWVRQLPGERVIYYNLDEYTFYEPHRFDRIRAQEREIVDHAALTLCLSVEMVERLRERHPERADRIHHFPLGVVRDFLNPDPAAAPEANTVGYVGNLTNRVDWSFVAEVARRTPELRYPIVGKLDVPAVGEDDQSWRADREAALALPNVDYVGAVPQAEVPAHYHRYAANWMPYDVDHGFNVAACPTKIMDAIASGRPFLSTDLPEARLYPDNIAITNDPDEAARMLRTMVSEHRPREAEARVAFASRNDWAARAAALVGMTR